VVRQHNVLTNGDGSAGFRLNSLTEEDLRPFPLQRYAYEFNPQLASLEIRKLPSG
jgi:hypothetical protein